MARWDYLVVEHDETDVEQIGTWLEKENRRAGWELVAAVPREGDAVRYYFRRSSRSED